MRIQAFGRLAILSIAAIAAALALLALSASDTRTADAQWIPNEPRFSGGYDIRLCNVLGASFGGPNILKGDGAGASCAQDGAAGGNPDVATVLNIPEGHHNYAQDYFVTSLAGFTLADHAPANIPLGTAMAGLESTVKLGLAANPCTNTIVPEFIFWNATIDNSPANEFAVQAEGTDDRFITLANEIPGDPTNSTGRDNDAFNGKADSNANVVTRYPDISNNFFDPDGDGIDTDGNPATLHDQPVQPVARYAALTQVPANGDWQLLQIFTFNSSDLRDAFSRNTGTGSTRSPSWAPRPPRARSPSPSSTTRRRRRSPSTQSPTSAPRSAPRPRCSAWWTPQATATATSPASRPPAQTAAAWPRSARSPSGTPTTTAWTTRSTPASGSPTRRTSPRSLMRYPVTAWATTATARTTTCWTASVTPHPSSTPTSLTTTATAT